MRRRARSCPTSSTGGLSVCGPVAHRRWRQPAHVLLAAQQRRARELPGATPSKLAAVSLDGSSGIAANAPQDDPSLRPRGRRTGRSGRPSPIDAPCGGGQRPTSRPRRRSARRTDRTASSIDGVGIVWVTQVQRRRVAKFPLAQNGGSVAGRSPPTGGTSACPFGIVVGADGNVVRRPGRTRRTSRGSRRRGTYKFFAVGGRAVRDRQRPRRRPLLHRPMQHARAAVRQLRRRGPTPGAVAGISHDRDASATARRLARQRRRTVFVRLRPDDRLRGDQTVTFPGRGGGRLRCPGACSPA